MIDLTDISGTNCYCDDVAASEICRRIDALPEIPLVRFIDSGNYHYMSLFFMRKITIPFTLLLLDNHPDTKPPVFGNITSCGGWVREATETIPNLRQVIMAGVDQKLIEEESPLPEQVISVGLTDLPSHLKNVTTPLYISLDKDIMNTSYASTDWTQGPYTLDDMIDVLKEAYASCDVIGLDICGEKKEDPTSEDLLINEKTNQIILDQL
ncbi:MAG: arginase [Lachnospiraceae bacterium]|nr:arginase [Lachnospiraceae bacterium]